MEIDYCPADTDDVEYGYELTRDNIISCSYYDRKPNAQLKPEERI
jgi:hypothetical protein